MKDESLWDAISLKMRVYGMKDESLWDAISLKMRVYGMKVEDFIYIFSFLSYNTHRIT